MSRLCLKYRNKVKITIVPQDYFRSKHLVAAGETLPVEWDVSLLIKTHIRRSENIPARQLHVMFGRVKLQRCTSVPLNSVWIKMAGRSWIAAIHKKSFIVFFCLLTFFLMMATDHLFLYNKRTALNDWKPKKMQTYQIKSKPILDSVVLLFLSCASSRPRLFSVWFELLAQMCVSPVQRRVLGFSSAVSVWMEVGSWSWVWFCVRSGSVEVRCGWVGARGWTAGCSPPSPWWSSEEQTACWGTTGEERTTVTQTVMSQTSARARVHSWLWKK